MHARKFVVKVLDKEEPGARVWLKLMSFKLPPKIDIFKSLGYLPVFLHNLNTYTIVYFSYQITKISWEKLFLYICHAHFYIFLR